MAGTASEMAQTVGANMRLRRYELFGKRPRPVADKLGVEVKTLERWERGETNGAVNHIELVAKVLNTTPQALMAKQGKPQNELAELIGRVTEIEDGVEIVLRILAGSGLPGAAEVVSDRRPEMLPSQEELAATGATASA